MTTTDSTEVVTNPLVDASSLVEAVSEEDIRGEIEGVQQALDSLLFAVDAADFEASVPVAESADA